MRAIEDRFHQQDIAIAHLRGHNNELAGALAARDAEIGQLRELVERQRKSGGKEASKLKRAVKDKDRDLLKLRTELQSSKLAAEEYRYKLEDAVRQRGSQMNNPTVPSSSQFNNRPSTSHQPVVVNDDSQKVRELNQAIQKLQGRL